MKKKILIIEDYNNIVEILTMRLNAMGYEVISAKDGQEGLTLARQAFKTEVPSSGFGKIEVARPQAIGGTTGRIVRLPGPRPTAGKIVESTSHLRRGRVLLHISNALITVSPEHLGHGGDVDRTSR